MTQVWVLTDERYLAQRMPRLLVDELRARRFTTRTLVAERLVQSLGPAGDGLDPWRDLRPGDVVLARTRNRAGRLGGGDSSGCRGASKSWSRFSVVRCAGWSRPKARTR